MDTQQQSQPKLEHSFRTLCNVVNLRGDQRYDLSAVMGEIERWQEAAARLTVLAGDAECVAQWFEDSWTGSTDEPVYQAAMRLRRAALGAER